jgi:hypothetical protein
MVIMIIRVIETLLLMIMWFTLYLWLTDISARNDLVFSIILFRNALIGSKFYVALICMAHMLNSLIFMLRLFSSKVNLLVEFLQRWGSLVVGCWMNGVTMTHVFL